MIILDNLNIKNVLRIIFFYKTNKVYYLFKSKFNFIDKLNLRILFLFKINCEHKQLKCNEQYFENINLANNLIDKYFKNKNIHQIIEFMKSDKKNFNKNINLVLLKKIGLKPIINSYSSKKVEQFLIKKLN